MKKVKFILLVLGLVLFGYLVYAIGPKAIWDNIVNFKWRLLIIIAIYPIIYWFDTLGWKYALAGTVPCGESEASPQGDSPRTRPNFSHLFTARLAGEAVNYITMGYLGGEPIKAKLLKDSHNIPMTQGLSSVVIAKTTLVISEIIFVIAGLLIAMIKFNLSPNLRNAVIIGLCLGTVFIALFFFGQKNKLFSTLLKIAKKLRLAPGFFSSREEKIKALDENIALFYNTRKKDFALSLSFHLLGWIAGVIEVYLILTFLGIDCGLYKAFVIEALAQMVKATSFMVPASMGTQEGGNLVIFLALGLGALPGITMSIVRRIREVAWAGIGLAVLAGYEIARK